MVVIEPGRFQMGSPISEASRENNEDPHEIVIDYSFAMAAHEVTNSEFRRLPDHAAWKKQVEAWVDTKRVLPVQRDEPRLPAVGVSWYEATKYCNWLSQRDGLSKDQWCYEPNPAGNFGRRNAATQESSEAHGLPPADRSGMGICMPGRDYHQPLFWTGR